MVFTALAISGSTPVRDQSLDGLYDEILTMIYEQRSPSENLTDLVCPKVSRSIMRRIMAGRNVSYKNHETAILPLGAEAWTVSAWGDDILRTRTLFIKMDETDSCLAVFQHRSGV